MNFHLKLLWLAAVLLTVTRCEAADTDDADDTTNSDGTTKGDMTDADDPDVAGEEAADGEGADPMEEDDGSEGADETEAPEDAGAEEPMDAFDPLSGDQIKELFKKMDGNANGKVSLAEVTDFAHKMRRVMAKMELNDVLKPKDTNKDGKLTFAEFLGNPGDVAEERQNEMQNEFKELDINGDTFVDGDEMAAVFHHHVNEKVEHTLTNMAMKDKDVDKNGALTLKEFYHHLQSEDEEAEEAEISPEEKDTFNKLDIDGSGSLTLKELKAWESGSHQAEEAVKKLFEHADKDNDNVLTAEEIDNARHTLAKDHDVDAQMYLMQWAENHHHSEL